MSQHFHISTPKANKSHTCKMCGRIIDAGEHYLRGAGMDGATAWTWIECAHCEAFRRLYDIAGWNSEGTYGPDDFADFDAPDIYAARLRASWGMQWRTSRGSLLPVPRIEVIDR